MFQDKRHKREKMKRTAAETAMEVKGWEQGSKEPVSSVGV